MKTFNVILFGLMALCLTAKAQTPDVSPLMLKGQALKEYLSEPTNKANYIAQLNATLCQTEECIKRGVEIYDVDVYVDSTQTSDQGGDRRGASIRDAGGFYNDHNTYKIYYNSVNGQNRTTRLSEVIYVPRTLTGSDDYIKFGLLSCHPTVSSLSECPTGPSAPEAAIRAMADEDCMVVCPDYCGYGISANEVHPYLIQDVTARNCIDGYLAAEDLCSAKFKVGFHSYFIGYSQGGSVALACQKMYETKLSDVDKNKIKLQHTYCGDGPYSTYATINQYVDWLNAEDETLHKIAYPSVMGLIMLGAKDAYDKDCMRTVKPEDYFKPEYLSQTDALNVIRRKTARMTEINEAIWAKGIETIDQIMSEKLLIFDQETKKWKFNTSTNECQCLFRALEKNDVAAGWNPTIPITFLHYDDDLVVPYANMQYITELISTGKWTNPVIECMNAAWAYKNGKISPVIALQVDAALKKGWDHVSVGTLFYCWFMFGEDNVTLRENNKKKYNGDD